MGVAKKVVKKKSSPIKKLLIALLIILLIPVTLIGVIYALFFDSHRKDVTPTTDVNLQQLALKTGVVAFKGTHESNKIEFRVEEELINGVLANLLKDKIVLPIQNASVTMWVEFSKEGKYLFNLSFHHTLFKTRACLTTKLYPYVEEKNSSGEITFLGMKFIVENIQIGRINIQSIEKFYKFIPQSTIAQINQALAKIGLSFEIDIPNLQIKYSYENIGKDIKAKLGGDESAETYASLLGVLMPKMSLNNGKEGGYLGIDADLSELKNLTLKDKNNKDVDILPEITSPFLNLSYDELCVKQEAMSATMEKMKTDDITMDNIADLTNFFFIGDYCRGGAKDIRDKYLKELTDLGYIEKTDAGITYKEKYGKVFSPEKVDLENLFETEITNKLKNIENLFTLKTDVQQPIEVEDFDLQTGYPVGLSYETFVDIDENKLKQLDFTIKNSDIQKMFTDSKALGVGYSLYSKYIDKEAKETTERYHLSSAYLNDVYTRSVKYNGNNYYCLGAGLSLNGSTIQAGIVSKYESEQEISDNKIRLYIGEDTSDAVPGIYLGDIKGNSSVSEFLIDLISSESSGGYNVGGNIIKFSKDYKYIEIDFNTILNNEKVFTFAPETPIKFKRKTALDETEFYVTLNFAYDITFTLLDSDELKEISEGKQIDPNGGINIKFDKLKSNFTFAKPEA